MTLNGCGVSGCVRARHRGDWHRDRRGNAFKMERALDQVVRKVRAVSEQNRLRRLEGWDAAIEFLSDQGLYSAALALIAEKGRRELMRQKAVQGQ